MPGPLRSIARLIVVILLVQVALAPAHCLAMAATPAGLLTVLCSPSGGERTIIVGPDGHALPEADGGAGACVVCTGLAPTTLPTPPAVPAFAWAGEGRAWHVAGAETLPPPARAPPFAPRAPPAFA
ncbi:DUF2946 family protein [Roseomonas sp. CECT 9278]|uniref:DUF2946 family protein n=1 Tax=Roseomonas sp. CECT 9278 TaxID=2845823 RepID=UPI001E4F9AAB|nr:DUF2946 family protein [Roseomonas sp. CECT 9278]CAH0290361.1 hypothetical protein ROS9278_04209 [Roseomonas sp. CECT 9278]